MYYQSLTINHQSVEEKIITLRIFLNNQAVPKLPLFPDSRTLTPVPPKEQNQVDYKLFSIITSNQY